MCHAFVRARPSISALPPCPSVNPLHICNKTTPSWRSSQIRAEMRVAVLPLKPPPFWVARLYTKKLTQHRGSKSATRIQRFRAVLHHPCLLHPERRVASRECASVDATHVGHSAVEGALVEDDGRPSLKIRSTCVRHRHLRQGLVRLLFAALRLEKRRFVVPGQHGGGCEVATDSQSTTCSLTGQGRQTRGSEAGGQSTEVCAHIR